MAKTNKTLYDELDALRADLQTRAASEAKNTQFDMGSTELLNDLYGEVTDAQNYDVETDPAYAGLKKAAYRESDRTMRDVLAQGNARTNGFANSAAITAASQARDYTMAQYDDKIAELEDRALSRKNAQISAKMQLLSAIEGMEATKRQNYLNDLELLENAANENRSAAESEAANILNMGGIPSDELMTRAGWSAEYIAAVKQNAYDSMDTASMQRYLNSMGANLSVDGQWGPKTEAAYKKVFGKSSGRQQSAGGYSYNPGSNPTEDTPEASGGDALSIAEVQRNIAGSRLDKNTATEYINELYANGKISTYQAGELKRRLG